MAIVPVELEVKFKGEADGTWLFVKGTESAIAKVDKMTGVIDAATNKFKFDAKDIPAIAKDGFLMVK